MAYSLNKVMLIGNLTESPQMRQTPSGTNVVDLNLRVIAKFTRDDDGSLQNSTSFHTVVLWARMAEVADQYLKAGSQVYISGRLKTEEWEGEDGKKRRKTKVIAEELILLDSRNALPPLPQESKVGGGLCRAEILGNVARDLELRQTPNGVNVCNFGVATNRKWRGADENLNEETEFHNIVVWGDLAVETADKIKKGHKVFLAGRISNRGWETPEGEKRRTTEIVADEVLQLGFFDESAISQNENSAPRPTVKPEPQNNSNESSGGNFEKVESITHESEIKPEDLPF